METTTALTVAIMLLVPLAVIGAMYLTGRLDRQAVATDDLSGDGDPNRWLPMD